MTAQSFRLPPPPAAASSFFADDLDEVREFVGRSDGEHSRVVHGVGRLAFERHVLIGSSVGLCWGRVALGQTIRGALGALTLHLSIDAPSEYLFGRRRIRVAPGSGMIVAPRWEFTRRGSPGGMFALAVSDKALSAEIRVRRPEGRGDWVPSSRPLDLLGTDRSAIESAVDGLAGASDSATASATREQCEACVISMVADIVLRAAAVSPAAPIAASRFAMLQEWIEAHLGEPVTLGSLCQVAGVSDRSLQTTFASLRGVSPMRYVNERRLAAARRLLARAEADSDVTDVATAVGFTHLGRFATFYRQAYGESPSQTLKG